MLQVKNIEKKYGSQTVLRGINFELASGKVLSVLGRSGCGKTTLLKIIAGLEKPEKGELYWNKQNLSILPPPQRGIVYLYQEALLFPHLPVWENLAFGLKLRRYTKKDIQNKVEEMLLALGLEAEAQKMPHQLSGGQKQRVSFGRALIIQPRVLLLDEPFGSLDSQTRRAMQALFLSIAQQFELTAIFVSHDVQEALRMGDHLGRMDEGQVYIYPSQEAFLDDPKSGAQEEIKFWEQFKHQNHEKGL